jgi:histidine triad (HIT) family protein
MATDCIFCKIAAGDIPGDFVYRDDDVFVIRDIAPKAPVHLLVIPTKHFEALTHLTLDDQGMVGAMFHAAREAAQNAGVAEGGYRLVINQGENGRQDVPHLHIHVMGGKRLGAMG